MLDCQKYCSEEQPCRCRHTCPKNCINCEKCHQQHTRNRCYEQAQNNKWEWIVDTHDTVIHSNGAHLAGYTDKEIIGRCALDFIANRNTLPKGWLPKDPTINTFTGRPAIRAKNGTTLILNATAVAIKNQKNQIIAYHGQSTLIPQPKPIKNPTHH